MTKEQLQEQLFNYLTVLIDKGELIAEEIPKVLEELLIYKTFFYSMNSIVLCLTFCFLIKLINKLKKHADLLVSEVEKANVHNSAFIIYCIAIVNILFLLINIYYFVMVTLTPRYYLLNHIIDLTTGR